MKLVAAVTLAAVALAATFAPLASASPVSISVLPRGVSVAYHQDSHSSHGGSWGHSGWGGHSGWYGWGGFGWGGGYYARPYYYAPAYYAPAYYAPAYYPAYYPAYSYPAYAYPSYPYYGGGCCSYPSVSYGISVGGYWH